MSKNKSFKVLEDLKESKKDLPEDVKEANKLDVLEDKFHKDLEKDLHSIAERTREYVRAQVHDWQKIPYLAMKADGRTGYSDHKQYMYRYGYIPLCTISHNYDLFIDCETGELTTQIMGPQKDIPADDNDCVFLSMRLDTVKAKEFISDLEDEIKQPVANYYKNNEYEIFQKKTEEELNLKKTYKRE